MTPDTLLFAGGGSGGHVFPLLAVADAVTELAPALRIAFVGTERGMERRLVPRRGYALELVRVLPMRGGGARGALRGALGAANALPASFEIVRRHRPKAVFSIGGYAAGPVCVAARVLGIPVALMEPNAEIGLANRLVAPLVSRAYTAFADSARYFAERAVVQTGVPIRAGFAPSAYAPEHERLRLLVFGGSQGAKVLNESVPRALALISGELPGLSVVHQCGAEKEASTRALYAELGLADAAQVVPFIDDVPTAVASADLVVGRAGAGALSEICAIGRPSLLIPYPFAGDHQRHNARALVERGAAVCVLSSEASPDRLAFEIGELARAPDRRRTMADAARSLGRPDAARRIALDLLELAGVAPTRVHVSAPPPRVSAPLEVI